MAKALGISEPEKKRCGRCGEIKTPDAFYAGRAECKGCTKSRHRRRRALGLAREADRRRYHTNPRYRAQVAANTARWKARNADKLRVHEAVAQAIQRGRLERQPCEVCGAAAHAHHRDYARPLEVQWLCPWHHARQHLAEGRLGRRVEGS